MKEKTPVSIKLDPDLHQRLEAGAERTRIRKYALMIMAMEALVEALEKNDWKLVVPVKFEVTHIPRARVEVASEEQSLIEDSGKEKVSYRVNTSTPAAIQDAEKPPASARDGSRPRRGKRTDIH